MMRFILVRDVHITLFHSAILKSMHTNIRGFFYKTAIQTVILLYNGHQPWICGICRISRNKWFE